MQDSQLVSPDISERKKICLKREKVKTCPRFYSDDSLYIKSINFLKSTAKVLHILGYRDGSIANVLTLQAWKPDFNPQNTYLKKPGMWWYMLLISVLRNGTGGSMRLAGSLASSRPVFQKINGQATSEECYLRLSFGPIYIHTHAHMCRHECTHI